MVLDVLRVHLTETFPEGPVVLVHGGATGLDSIAHHIWPALRAERAELLEPEVWPATGFSSPRARNQHMVNLGADVVAVFAMKWDSGSGMTGRMARRAGLHVIDYGADTAAEARPKRAVCPCGKVAFPSEAAAGEAVVRAKIANQLHNRQRRREQRVYPCPHWLDTWHVTSQPDKGRRTA